MRLVILGGGGFRVPLIHRALLRRPQLGIDELVLADSDPSRLAVIRAVLAGPDGPTIRTTTSLRDALTGADVVFSAIRVGGADGRAADERRALDLGVLGQETVGAGGLAYGLRTVPVALDIARAIEELAPRAWTINFTNPAGMITEAMRTVLGGRVIGICDSPVGLIRRVCRALGVPPGAVDADYAGINHLGWLRSVHLNGTDLLPGLLDSQRSLASFEEGRLFGPDLLRSIGAIPNEYLYFYYAGKDVTATLSAGSTRGELLSAAQRQFYFAASTVADTDPAAAERLWRAARDDRESTYLAETRPASEHRDAADLSGGGYQEVALDLIEALTGGVGRELIVNVANGATFPALPADLVIESRCRVDAGGAVPLAAATFTLHQLGLVAAVRAAERAVIDAVRFRSRREALRAFTIHPLVGSPRVAARLLDGVLADHPHLAELLR